MRSAYIIVSAVIAAFSASAHAQTGQAACERLRTLHSSSSRILSAEFSVAGEFRAHSRVIQSAAYDPAGALLCASLHSHQPW